MLTAEEKKKLAKLRRRAAKRGMSIRFINEIIFDSPRTNNIDSFELALDELDAQDNAE